MVKRIKLRHTFRLTAGVEGMPESRDGDGVFHAGEILVSVTDETCEALRAIGVDFAEEMVPNDADPD